MTDTGRYQDYVIKDGKFIGKFDEMYQNFSNPWHQTEAVQNSYSRYATVLTLKKLNAKKVLEIGCGLGNFTNYLATHTNIDITGMDISQTAVNKAREKYSSIKFITEDLVQYSKHTRGGYDVLIFSEIMWYILEDIKDIISNMNSMKNVYIIVNQTFYKEGIQHYGTEYFTNLNEMIRFFPWKNLLKMETVLPGEESYETHSLFRV